MCKSRRGYPCRPQRAIQLDLLPQISDFSFPRPIIGSESLLKFDSSRLRRALDCPLKAFLRSVGSPSATGLLRSTPSKCCIQTPARHPVESVLRKGPQLRECMVFDKPRPVRLLYQLFTCVRNSYPTYRRVRRRPFLGALDPLEVQVQPVVSGVAIRRHTQAIVIQVHSTEHFQPLTNSAERHRSGRERSLVENECP